MLLKNIIIVIIKLRARLIIIRIKKVFDLLAYKEYLINLHKTLLHNRKASIADKSSIFMENFNIITNK